YDLGGRRIVEKSPDRGMTKFTYDDAGRLVKKQTANRLHEGGNDAVQYQYEYDRLKKITYPDHPENNVTYTYGDLSDAYAAERNQVGRPMTQDDATGVQYFTYDRLGNLTLAVRAIAVAGRTSYWFKTKWDYDAWGRIEKITYPDEEEVTYHYDPAGQVNGISNHIPGINTTQDLVEDITYDEHGQRSRMIYGNGTSISYEYDQRQRLRSLKNDFAYNQPVIKKYTYDPLNNITEIKTTDNDNLLSLPGQGELTGPVSYQFTYDNYNRLKASEGYYIGPNDSPQTHFLGQEYELAMEYDEQHNIIGKTQHHRQGETTGMSVPQTLSVVAKTDYKLDYRDYGTGEMAVDGYSYVQPHSPREVVEYPADYPPQSPADPQVRTKEIDYDFEGNMTTIKEKTGDPEDPMDDREITLRHYRWDEEGRLRAVDLKPENSANRPE